VILALLAVMNIWAYQAMAQASMPLPPPPLLQGLPELPSANPASSEIQPIEGTPQSASSPGTPPNESPEPTSNQPASVGSADNSIQSIIPPVIEPIAYSSAITPIDGSISSQPSHQSSTEGQQQGQPAPPTTVELLSRIDRLDNKVANLEEQLRNIPQPQIPGIVKSPFSFNILLLVNLITFALVIYLLFRSQEKAVGPKHKEETKPLKNIKDYMRRYQAQGYQVENMKSFLIAQGYPRDLVEQAARDMEAEASFKF